MQSRERGIRQAEPRQAEKEFDAKITKWQDACVETDDHEHRHSSQNVNVGEPSHSPTLAKPDYPGENIDAASAKVLRTTGWVKTTQVLREPPPVSLNLRAMTALRALVTIGVAALSLFLAVPPIFESLHGGYTGVHPILTSAAIQHNAIRVDRGSPAYRAGLRTGDILGCMSARDDALLFAGPNSAAYRPGTLLSACVSRNGVVKNVLFAAKPSGPIPPAYPSPLLACLRILVTVIFMGTGIALVLARPSLMTWLLYAYCVTNLPSFAAQINASALAPWQYLLVSGVPSELDLIGVWFLLLFALTVPEDAPPAGWRSSFFHTFAAIAILDFAFIVYQTVETTYSFVYPFNNVIDEVFTGLTILIIIARLATMQRAERARFGWAAFAMVFGVVANDLRVVLSGNPATNTISIVAAYATVVMPLSLAYAILRRHVIDVRFVMSRSVVFAAITTFVVGVIGLVDWLTSTYLAQSRFAMAIDAAATIAIAFALHRIYNWIESGVDFILFRKKHDAEAYLARMSKTLLRAKKEETVDHALVFPPHEQLDLTLAALFRARGRIFVLAAAAGWHTSDSRELDEEHDLVRFLLTERAKVQVHELGTQVAAQFREYGGVPALAIPLFQGDALTGFVLYGVHRDGTRLDPDEVQALERLCDIAAQAYTAVELAQFRSGIRATGMPAMEAF